MIPATPSASAAADSDDETPVHAAPARAFSFGASASPLPVESEAALASIGVVLLESVDEAASEPTSVSEPPASVELTPPREATVDEPELQEGSVVATSAVSKPQIADQVTTDQIEEGFAIVEAKRDD